MPENEFEKNVFSEMQGLKISPSEEVWAKVEERIRRKKRRRFILIIFLLAGLGLLGYWQKEFLFGDGQKSIAGKSVPIKTNQPAGEENNTGKVSKEEGDNLNDEASKSNTSQKGSKIPGIREEKISEISAAREFEKNRNTAPVLSKNKRNTLPVQAIEEKLESAVQEKINKNERAILQEENKNNIKVQDEIDSVNSESEMTVSEPKKSEVEKKVIVDASLVDSSLITPQITATEKKWETGFFISPGISSMNENPVSFSKSRFEDLMSSPSPGSGGGVQSPAPPSVSKPGFAFQAGGFVQKNISKRSQIAAGLQLGYYSDRIHVGGKRDTLLPNTQYSQLSDANLAYAAVNPSENYTNRYWFLELPLTYQCLINKKTERPVRLMTGVSVSRLITTNALIYDTAFGGIYHNSRNYFNKTQFSLSAGIDWTFYQNKKQQWTLGPVLDFHLNPLLSNPFEKNKYLLFSGIRARLILNNPKN